MSSRAAITVLRPRLEGDRPFALLACRPGGIVSVMGVYGGLLDKFPNGPFMSKGLQLRAGQCHVHKYTKPLYEHIRNGTSIRAS